MESIPKRKTQDPSEKFNPRRIFCGRSAKEFNHTSASPVIGCMERKGRGIRKGRKRGGKGSEEERWAKREGMEEKRRESGTVKKWSGMEWSKFI